MKRRHFNPAPRGGKTAKRVYAYRVRAYKTGEDGPYSAFTQATPPYTGGVVVKTDRAVYTEPTLPPLPHAGGKWRDEVFGTEIMRATDEDDAGTPGLSTFYSHWPTFNANNTKLFTRKGNGGDAMLKDFDAVNFKLGASHSLPALPGSYSVAWEGATWSNTDPNIIYSFRFTYRKMSGDGTIIARVASLSNAASGAKAGVMMREKALGGGVRFASMLLSGDGTAVFRRRTTDDCSVNCDATNTTANSISAPYRVKLVRSGNTFTGYRSSDGSNWTQVGSETISMNGTV